MIEIKNRLPTKPNRWKITHESDSSQEYITWDYADEPTEVGTPINRGLIVGMYNDMTPCGIVKIFSSKEEREGYLLCDGSSVMGADYPDLIGKTKSYEIYEYMTMEDITGYQVSTKGNLCVANGKFFMMSTYQSSISERQKVWVSDDGETWTRIITNYDFTNGNDTLHNVIYANNKYYVFADNQNYPAVFIGSDLTSLTRTRIISNTSYYTEAAAYNNGVFVVGVKTDNTVPVHYIYTSTNGTTWTRATDTSFAQMNGGCSINVVNNKFYVGYYYPSGSTYKLFESSDGTTWTEISVSSIDNVPQRDGIYNNYAWRMFDNVLKYTSDYQTWTTYDTLDEEITAGSIFVDSHNRFFLNSAEGDNWVTNDLETFKRLGKENTVAAIFSNGETAIGANSGIFYRYDIDYNNPKLILPTLNDDTNQLYGYIKTEVE